jgi:hypothetical protein
LHQNGAKFAIPNSDKPKEFYREEREDFQKISSKEVEMPGSPDSLTSYIVDWLTH